MLSKECYEDWLHTRRKNLKRPEESFRRVLISHVKGTSGRKPFRQDEEVAILRLLRQRRPWPCFIDNSHSRVGSQGFDGCGYHERRQLNAKTDTVPGDVSSSIKCIAKTKNAVEETDRSVQNFVSSYAVFMYFATRSKVLSRECFEAWVTTRKTGAKNPEHSFRKALFAQRKLYRAFLYIVLSSMNFI